MQSEKSFLFIPDISGFTEFVNSTEIEHGQHIISELLEGIIESNQIDLEISEVEGDAVLFYKHKSIPTYTELVNQVEKTFIDFHERIKKFENLRICTCGACTSTVNLSLKVISHIGEIGFTHVQKTYKPYGADLVRVHRLLKNSIQHNEYLLMSDELTAFYKSEIDQWEKDWPKIVNTSLPDGDTNYQYSILTPLLAKVKEPEPVQSPVKVAEPYMLDVSINAYKEKVFSMILSFDNRSLWNKRTKQILYDKSKVNRKGTKHDCVLEDDTIIKFETISDSRKIGSLVYGERVLGSKIAKEIAIYYIVTAGKSKAESIVKAEIHISPIPVVGWILKPILVKKLADSVLEQLNNLKIVCELEMMKQSTAVA